MFNDKYGLTQAVLDGRKTMTRRLVPQFILDKVEQYQQDYYAAALESLSFEEALLNMVTGERMFQQHVFRVGEVVAIAQSYKNIEEYNPYSYEDVMISDGVICEASHPYSNLMRSGGWDNKMFVRADLMKHHIRITNIKVERLKDISDKDCLKEGITMITEGKLEIGNAYGWDTKVDALKRDSFFTPRDAFAALIDKVSGKGTWKSNPYVFCYTFELVD